MKYLRTPLEGAWIVEAEPFEDQRGIFVRIFCQNELREIQNAKPVEQINFSMTFRKGTVRGMHFQFPPKAEAKLVRCLRGSVYDVIVDLRQYSPTFLKWYGENLTGENMRMIYIPEGFAHGFQTLDKNCEMLYLHTEFYDASKEGGVRHDDPRIHIQWPLDVSEISEKDRNFPFLRPDFQGISL